MLEYYKSDASSLLANHHLPLCKFIQWQLIALSTRKRNFTVQNNKSAEQVEESDQREIGHIRFIWKQPLKRGDSGMPQSTEWVTTSKQYKTSTYKTTLKTHIYGHIGHDPLKFPLKCSTTLCLKNDTKVAHHNFNAHQPILEIFGRDVADRVCYQMMICYFTSPN